mmetsp:Transcript_7402/g.18385  ORF Transcript_7402/g.18385 Transcript_7402/m.18385 type:complete len:211 (+) Transcript_7402:291-923(+)
MTPSTRLGARPPHQRRSRCRQDQNLHRGRAQPPSTGRGARQACTGQTPGRRSRLRCCRRCTRSSGRRGRASGAAGRATGPPRASPCLTPWTTTAAAAARAAASGPASPASSAVGAARAASPPPPRTRHRARVTRGGCTCTAAWGAARRCSWTCLWPPRRQSSRSRARTSTTSCWTCTPSCARSRATPTRCCAWRTPPPSTRACWRLTSSL